MTPTSLSKVSQASPTASDGGLEPDPNVSRNRETAGKPRYTPLWNNLITLVGIFCAVISLVLLLTFLLFTIVSPAANPYVDIVGYLVLPGMLVISVVTIPFGILFKSWRVRRRNPEQHLAFRFPRIDLNDPAQRRAAKIVIGAIFVLLPAVGVSSYHGYHYTDSAEFCSTACHAVMHPQATTYQHSAHARVACAECHIGSGASWFVKAKLSGTRQVLAMWQNSYPRPIPSAITELRPARETCERCHWPKKFFGAQLRRIVRFSSDQANTRREVNMLLNTGGGDESTGPQGGIHAHMALENAIEYVATDDKLQDIPWVKWTDSAGNELVYRSDGQPSADPRPPGQLRQLDCMDCHNRPAHKFRSPQESVDIYLYSGKIDATLPFIKRQAVAALTTPYSDVDTAERTIDDTLLSFYRTNYPDLWDDRNASILQSVATVREIYRRSFFPEMKVDWRTYPDNIGHKISAGCFRCHEGRHVNQRGEAISHRCDVCHTFLSTVNENGNGALIKEGKFVHAISLDGRHAELRCSRCHTGGVAPSPTCAGCHSAQTQFRDGTLAVFESFDIPADPMAGAVDCEGCHDLSQPTNIQSIDVMCMECHEDEEDRFEGMLAVWKQEVDLLILDAGSKTDEQGRRLLQALRHAGPLHNIEATRLITRSLGATSMISGDR